MRLYCKTCRGHRGHREVRGALKCFGCEPPSPPQRRGGVPRATIPAALMAAAAMGNVYSFEKRGGGS